MKPLGPWWTLRLAPVFVDTESDLRVTLRMAKNQGWRAASMKMNGKGYKVWRVK